MSSVVWPDVEGVTSYGWPPCGCDAQDWASGSTCAVCEVEAHSCGFCGGGVGFVLDDDDDGAHVGGWVAVFVSQGSGRQVVACEDCSELVGV